MARLADTNTNPLFQPFLDSMFVVSHSEKTVKTYKSGLRNLERFTLQKYQYDLSKVISKIKAGELDIYRVLKEYVIHLDKAGKSPASIKTWTASAKEFFRYYEIKIYSEDFKQIIKMPKKTHYREEPMTKEIILRLLRNLPSRLQVLVLVAISSGMRIGEMMQLKISDIDFNSNPTKIRIRAEIAKGKQSRETFLTHESTSALKDHLMKSFSWSDNKTNSEMKDLLVFGKLVAMQTGTTQKISHESLRYSLMRYCKLIPELAKTNENGRNSIHFHAFRKYFRTVVGNAAGRDFAEALMGHRFYLDTYYNMSEEDKRKLYLKAESHLTISDYTNIESKLAEKNDLQKDIEIFVRKILKESFPLDPTLRSMILNEAK